MKHSINNADFRPARDNSAAKLTKSDDNNAKCGIANEPVSSQKVSGAWLRQMLENRQRNSEEGNN